jgi:hypothetical protein
MGSSMGERSQSMTRRRDLLRAVAAGLAVAAVGAVTVGITAAPAETETAGDKRKARYQANSAEVQDFYRVNRYPAP